MAVRHVILGNGVAGIEAATALRRTDASARITIVSAESDHFFSRPALMYVFAGQMRLQDTEPQDRGFYERMRFERVRGSAVGVDTGSLKASSGTVARGTSVFGVGSIAVAAVVTRGEVALRVDWRMG